MCGESLEHRVGLLRDKGNKSGTEATSNSKPTPARRPHTAWNAAQIAHDFTARTSTMARRFSTLRVQCPAPCAAAVNENGVPSVTQAFSSLAHPRLGMPRRSCPRFGKLSRVARDRAPTWTSLKRCRTASASSPLPGSLRRTRIWSAATCIRGMVSCAGR